MPGRTVIPSNRIWSSVGYSRAVRVGDVIEVAGTSSSGPDGQILYPDDMYRQAKHVCELIGKAVQDLGGSVQDVVRTRVFVTDISRWQEAGRAHGETFGANPPASAFYQVAALLHPDLLIEVEATAIVGSGPAQIGPAE
ncbi:MAG TPA: RidA family protein [Nakamurella sp.]|jgi:enamine deaminase RidA (YjgF/YER057c/UK114 family)|nr:RidA family protein [Nakamurella sp.]